MKTERPESGVSGPRRRVFVAVRVPAVVAVTVSATQTDLAPRVVDVKWVERENLHWTLRFFGAIEEIVLTRVIDMVRVASESITPFTVELSGVGAFPERGRPRVLWIGAGAGAERLATVAMTLEREFVAAGLGGADRPFKPHLTIGRLRPSDRRGGGGRRRGRGTGGGRAQTGRALAPTIPLQATAAIRSALEEVSFPPVVMTVDTVAVVESLLRPGGPIYRDLATACLGGPGDPGARIEEPTD